MISHPSFSNASSRTLGECCYSSFQTFPPCPLPKCDRMCISINPLTLFQDFNLTRSGFIYPSVYFRFSTFQWLVAPRHPAISISPPLLAALQPSSSSPSPTYRPNPALRAPCTQRLVPGNEMSAWQSCAKCRRSMQPSMLCPHTRKRTWLFIPCLCCVLHPKTRCSETEVSFTQCNEDSCP